MCVPHYSNELDASFGFPLISSHANIGTSSALPSCVQRADAVEHSKLLQQKPKSPLFSEADEKLNSACNTLNEDTPKTPPTKPALQSPPHLVKLPVIDPGSSPTMLPFKLPSSR